MSGITDVCYNVIEEMDLTGNMLSEDTVLKIVKSLDRVLAYDRLKGTDDTLQWIGPEGAYRWVY